MTQGSLLLNVADHVAVVSFNRPEVLNALDRQTIARLGVLLDDLSRREDVRVIILTGVGKAFSAGDDLREAVNLSRPEFYDLIMGLQQLTRRLRSMRKPNIAAVAGYALGGGLELAVSCDLRVCTDDSQFGMPEVNIGQAITNGSSLILSQIVGEGIAREMILTGELIDAHRAYQIGLVNRVVPKPDLMDSAMELASRISSRSSASIYASKSLVDEVQKPHLERALLLEFEAITQLYGTDQFREGINAFLEKRDPIFFED